jgi:hypothetical protein
MLVHVHSWPAHAWLRAASLVGFSAGVGGYSQAALQAAAAVPAGSLVGLPTLSANSAWAAAQPMAVVQSSSIVRRVLGTPALLRVLT